MLNIHSAQHADFGLPAAHSWLKSQKAVAQELIFIFSEVVWKPSWVVFFHPDLYFCDDSFFCSFLSKDGKEHKLYLGWVFPPSLPSSSHGHTWWQIPPGPSASHLTYRIRGCSGNFKGRKTSQIHIEIIVAWAHLCVRHGKFSIRDLWLIYSCHKKSCSVASRSHLWVSPSMKFPQRVNKSFSQSLGLWQGSASSSAWECWTWHFQVMWNTGLHSGASWNLPVWAIAQCALYEQGPGFPLCGWGTCTQAKKQNINFITYHISFPRYPPASLCWRSYRTLVWCQNTGDQQDFKAWFITHRTSKEKSQFPEFLFLISAFGVWPQLIFLICRISTAQAVRLWWHPIGLRQEKPCSTSSNDSYFGEEEHHL